MSLAGGAVGSRRASMAPRMSVRRPGSQKKNQLTRISNVTNTNPRPSIKIGKHFAFFH